MTAVSVPSFYHETFQCGNSPNETRSNGSPVLYNSHFERFMRSTQSIADAILQPDAHTDQSGQHVGRVRFLTFPIILNSFNNTYQPTQVSYRRNDDMSGFVRLIAIVAGLVIGGVGMYFLGQNIRHIGETGDELNEVYEMKDRISMWQDDWNYTYLQADENRLLNAMYQLANTRENFFKRVRHKAMLNLALIVGTVASAVLCITGGIIASNGFLIASLAVGIITGAGLLFKLGYYAGDLKEKRMAYHMQDNLNVLKRQRAPIRI